MSATARSFEAHQRAANRRTLLLAGAGVALVAILVAAVAGMVLSFSGAFTDYVAVTATLPPGQPVDPGALVTFRQVQVGTVQGEGRTTRDGSVVVTLHLTPSKITNIPSNVSIAVAPASIFGVQSVVLTPSPAAAGRLHAGEMLAAATTGSASLQGTLADTNRLLTGLHPAQIDTTLNALGTALQGQGPSVGQAVDRLTAYLDGMIPQLPTFNNDIASLGPVLDGLSAAVPNLLATASNSATVAQTVTGSAADLTNALGLGRSVADQSTQLLTSIDGALHAFLTNFLPILVDVQANPDVIPQTLTNLNLLATKLFPALEQGPYVKFEAGIFLSNPMDSLFAGSFLLPAPIANSEAQYAFASLMNPPTYTAANCPSYGTEKGPNCGTATAAATQAAASRGVATTAVAPAAQQQVATALLSQASGASPATTSPAAAAVLGSLLGSLGSA
ncbi:MCE family protein [Acidiferrimicrobium sp. IK]|uniref:MCE family protein n=1 Tax=Acidiferrimicrobium sp. IK TaxID=2871700 RepID=UPI0021CAE435|nr:MCE family protein [Acidiferrimicrobium sp. IK]MCU4186136.1 MCE family protein [Acidiferrimicrobium sp. IK]